MQQIALLALAAAVLLLGASPDPNAAFKAGDFEAARLGYSQQLQLNPNDTEALVGLATVELYDNDLTGAHRDLLRALKIDPSNERAQRLNRTLAVRNGKIGDFQITQKRAAVLPFVSDAPLPVVRLSIDGATANVAIDTGAPVLVVTSSFAHTHNLQVTNAGEGTFAGGRRARVQEAMIADVSAGPLTVKNVRASVFAGPGLSSPAGRIDGIIGTAFFAHFLTTIDYPSHRLILQPAGTSPDANAVADVPMWLVGDHFIFAKGSVNDSPALLNVDSGAGFGIQLTKAVLDAAHITPRSDQPKSFMGGGGATRTLPFLADSVSLGGARQTDVSGVYFPDGDQYGVFPFTVAGTVSGGFLKRYAVTFDFKSMRISLK